MSPSRTTVARRPPAEPPRPRPRAELSRARILSAALDLIDEKGLKALNMRDLGVALGTSTMGVYRHFHNKSELLDAAVDHVTEGFAPKAMQGPWQAQARALSLGVRAAMLAHPELADLIGRELRRSPTSLRVNAAIIERLHVSGLPRSLLAAAYWTISSYTTGYTLLEAQTYRHRPRTEPLKPGPQRVRKLAAMLQAVEDIPAEAMRDAAQVLARPLDDEQFLFGLDCLIRGLEDKVPAAAQTEA